MRALARFVILGRWWVIGATILFLPFAAIFGGDVASRLSVGGFEDPGSESSQAAEILDERFQAGVPDFVILVDATDGDIDSPQVTEAGAALTEELEAEETVISTVGYWDEVVPQNIDLPEGELSPLSSNDGSQALIVARLEGTEDEAIDAAEELSKEYTVEDGPVTTSITGASEVARQVSEQAEKDLQRSELMTAPVTFVALVLVFGAVVAGLLPLAVGLVAVFGTFVVLTLLTGVTDVSVFALNLTTGLGLGLAIDYSLFIVSRYREELAGGLPMEVAIARTMQTAGRTVAFSAATVIVSMLALLAFPILYLRSFAYAGVAVVIFAAVASIIVLPAILAALGPRVDKGRLFKHKEHVEGTGFWYHQAHRVMRHPVPYAVGVTAFLLVLAIPFFHLEVGQVDDRVIPDSHSSRSATDQIRENFSTRESGALNVLVPEVDPEADTEEISDYAARLSAVDNVVRVDTITGFFRDGEQLPLPASELSEERFGDPGSTWLSVVPDVEPISPEGEALVADVRALDAPFEVLVGGPSAELVDTKSVISERLPWAIGLIALATFVLLFLMVGSLLVPVKALLLNVLSLTATFGGMVWIFQDGHLSDFLDFTPTGTIDVFTPILMFCIAFGLSMDYEVFLLSRIKEEYDLKRDNEAAVAVGLQHTGRIVTAAAIILAIVFVAIATSEVAVVKLFGLGLTVAVLVDAFLIRATLVPAFMRLAGRSNWWAPKPLRRFHLRFGIWENEPIAILDRRDGLAPQGDTTGEAPAAETEGPAEPSVKT